MQKTDSENLTVTSTVNDMLSHPALKSFGVHLLPRPADAGSRLPLNQIGRLMPWHGFVQPQTIVRVLNRMIADESSGKQDFYSFYKDPDKRKNTGLFFFRGRPGAPFALIMPGGGFAYVGTLHEGLPLADYLSQKGFNAFVLQYRTGGERIACEDMAAALTWIFDHAAELKISTENYSVWGGSAGARLAADMGSYGSAALGGKDLPKPAAVIMAYTGHSRYTKTDPPTFAVVSADDPIASSDIMEARLEAMKRAGIPTEFHLYRHAGHGFGTGEGSDAEGWMDLAIRFWEKFIGNKRETSK